MKQTIKTATTFPGNWNGIDQKVYDLAISCTAPGQELMVTVENAIYETKTVQGNFLLTVRLFKNNLQIARWTYDTVKQEEVNVVFTPRWSE